MSAEPATTANTVNWSGIWQKLLPLLPPNSTLQAQLAPLTQALLAGNTPDGSDVSTLLKAMQDNSTSGQALMRWLTQVVLSRQSPPNLPTPLLNQLLQQQLSLPNRPASPAQQGLLDNLLRATLQFMQQAGSKDSSLSPSPQSPLPPATSAATANASNTKTAPDAAGKTVANPANTDAKTAVVRNASNPDTPQSLSREPNRLLQKLGNLLSPTTKEPAQMAAGSNQEVAPSDQLENIQAKTAATLASPLTQPTPVSQPDNELPRLMPAKQELGEWLQLLSKTLATGTLPSVLQTPQRELQDHLNSPILTSDNLKDWLAFLQQPLSASSSNARAFQQWAFTLLTIRLQQLQTGNAQTEPQRQWSSAMQTEASPVLHKLTEAFLGQMERMNQLQQDTSQVLPPYIPFPPQQPTGRESGLSLKRGKGQKDRYQWTLTFFVDAAELGPIQIKACLDIPDIQIQVMAERLAAVDKVRETLPILEDRFRTLGLSTGSFHCRQGKVPVPSSDVSATDPSPQQGFSIRI